LLPLPLLPLLPLLLLLPSCSPLLCCSCTHTTTERWWVAREAHPGMISRDLRSR
jgi:hypothetical protein